MAQKRKFNISQVAQEAERTTTTTTLPKAKPEQTMQSAETPIQQVAAAQQQTTTVAQQQPSPTPAPQTAGAPVQQPVVAAAQNMNAPAQQTVVAAPQSAGTTVQQPAVAAPQQPNPIQMAAYEREANLAAYYGKQPPYPTPQAVPQSVTPYDEVPQKFRGRKKVVRTIEKVNGKTLYFDPITNSLLRNVAWNTQLDMQDIIRVAVIQFLKAHAPNDQLDETGKNLVIEYIKATTIVG